MEESNSKRFGLMFFVQDYIGYLVAERGARCDGIFIAKT